MSAERSGTGVQERRQQGENGVSTLTGDENAAAVDRAFAADVAAALTTSPKQLPSKYFYDELGSALFEAVCRLPWYRITRAESALLERHARAILQPLRCPLDLVELGCGSGDKLATLIESSRVAISRVQLIDISQAALDMATQRIEPLTARGVAAHLGRYEEGLARVASYRSGRPLVMLFLGSNIGNFDREGARALLRRVRAVLQPGDALVLGTDLVKPERDLLLAYDDPLQVTAAFNRNLLRRINDELGGTFDLSRFAHEARWNGAERRVEMHLVSLGAQRVRVEASGIEVAFADGETIWTESSHKYEPEELVAEGRELGFPQAVQWVDEEARFALTRFTV